LDIGQSQGAAIRCGNGAKKESEEEEEEEEEMRDAFELA